MNEQEPEYHVISPFDVSLSLGTRIVNVIEVPNVLYAS